MGKLLHVYSIGYYNHNIIGVSGTDTDFSVDSLLFVRQAGLIVIDLDVAAVYQAGIVDNGGVRRTRVLGGVLAILDTAPIRENKRAAAPA